MVCNKPMGISFKSGTLEFAKWILEKTFPLTEEQASSPVWRDTSLIPCHLRRFAAFLLQQGLSCKNPKLSWRHPKKRERNQPLKKKMARTVRQGMQDGCFQKLCMPVLSALRVPPNEDNVGYSEWGYILGPIVGAPFGN